MGWEWFVSAVLAEARLAVFGYFEEKIALWRRLSKWAFCLRRDRGVAANAGDTLDVRLDLWLAQPGAGVPPMVVQKARHRIPSPQNRRTRITSFRGGAILSAHSAHSA